MARNQRSYDNEYKAQAVKLAQEIGGHKAATELGIPDGTIYCWIKVFKEGRLKAESAVHTPNNALSLNSEVSKKQRLMFIAIKTEDGTIKVKSPFIAECLTFPDRHSAII